MINSDLWVKTLSTKQDNQVSLKDSKLNADKWINTIPKKKSYKVFKRYSLLTALFVIGLTFVTVVKNETRNLDKQINNLKTSINNLQFDVHYAELDFNVISSPENIYKLADKFFDFKLISYKKSQIQNIDKINNLSKQEIAIKKNSDKTNIKTHLTKKIINKKNKIKNLKNMYSDPEKIPSHLKTEISKKIENSKKSIENVYSDPKSIISGAKAQRWAAFQVVKAIVGIPVIPGK